MLKVGFNRHFHKNRCVSYWNLVLLIAALFPAIGAFAQPTIKSGPVTTGTYGSAYVYNITTNDWPNPVDIHLNATAPGLTLTDNLDGTAVLSGTPTAAGTFPIIIEVVDPSDSQASTQQFDLVVAKAILDVTADDKSKTYGANNPAFTISYSGFVFTDNTSALSSLPTASSTASVTSHAGTLPITVSGGASDNYQLAYHDGVLTIGKAVLTATADSKTRPYGSANPSFTISYTGFVNSETETVLDATKPNASVSGATTDAGSYAINVAGGLDNDYTFSYVPGTLTVTKLTVTATATAQSKVYGAALPTLAFTYAGFVGADGPGVIDTPPTISTTATPNSHVGSYPITLAGGADNNYNITLVDASLTVTKASLTITAQPQSRPYGAANPALTVTYSGFVPGDGPGVFTTPLQVSTPATPASPVGSYGIVPSAATADDYNIGFTSGSLSVTKATLTVIADDKTRTYGASNPSFTVHYAGFVNSETEANIGAASASSIANATSVVGNYSIVPTGGTSTNYSFVYVNGTLSVTPATVTVSAQTASRTYGSPDPVFTASYSGFLNGQNSTVLTTQPTGTTNAVANSDVGDYDITFSGAAAQNYIFIYVNSVLHITKATLNAKAEDKSRTYGANNPTFTILYTGFKNGESATVISTPLTIGTTATPASNAGTYPITVSGGAATNYTFTYTPGTLTVGKATILATAENKTRVYGALNPSFTLIYSGLIGSDVPSDIQTPPTMSTTAGSASPVGPYTITISGGSDENYDFNYANGTLSITKAILTAKPNAATRTYGAANPTFTVGYTGFANGENASVVNVPANTTTIATNTSNVGTYDITASGASATNYDFVYTPGTLTITRATLTLTAPTLSRAFGAANPAFTITYSGFQNGETQAVLDLPAPVASTTATTTSSVGAYPINIATSPDNNYTLNVVVGTLNVTKAVLTVTAEDKTRPYNTANPAFTLLYSGFLNGDGIASISTLPTASTSATLSSPVASYSITPAGGVATNYSFSYVNGTLTITKATPVVTWNNPAMITYGTALGPTQLNASSPVLGDFEYTRGSGTILNAGLGQILSVKFTPSDLTNYDIVPSKTVTIDVDQATPAITWANPAAITYGTALSSTQLNATTPVTGSFAYTPAAPTVLDAGVRQLRADFTPQDGNNYKTVSVTRNITVNKANPVITWSNPAPITYGTPLGDLQLNATANIEGSFTYIPGKDAIIAPGNQLLSVNFTPKPELAGNYNAVNGTTVLITVLKATPSITWNTPADIFYGTALGPTQLNATANVPGAFDYGTLPNAVLSAGNGQTLTARFTPDDQQKYNVVTGISTTINVLKANPVITWANPAAITYGTPLSATQLNASTPVMGVFSYNHPLTTVLNAGTNQPLIATFTPQDQSNYNTVVTNRTITVNKATPVVTWANPAQITYGTPLKIGQQLNATANVTGAFEYDPGDNAILDVGINRLLSVKFTPGDLLNYNIVPVTTALITVVKATPVITWATPLPIKTGVQLTSTQLNASSNVGGTFVYDPDFGTSFATEGVYPLKVAFTPTNAANYNSVPNTQVNITVSSKDNPVITWNDPAPITYGTALSSTQLNASANVLGLYTYDPPLGTKLDAGPNKTLKVTFTPLDFINYNTVSKTVLITVNKATLTATAQSVSRVYGAPNPSFVINYSGFVNGENSNVIDTPPTATCAAIASDNAGTTFPIVPAGGADNNYQFSYVNGTLTINKATLTAKADNQSRTYGNSNPAFTISYTGFVNGDNQSSITPPTASTTATITSNVGNYAITLTGGAATNYNITNQNGTLAVTQALLAVVGDDLSRSYGVANPDFTFKYLGFKNGDTKETAIQTAPTASTTATITSPVGTYPVNISGGSATNYSLAAFPGTLTVGKAALIAKANDQTRVYGAANPPNSITYTGFKNSDTQGSITQPTITPATATATSDAGTYPILLSGGSAANYELILQNGTLTVTKKTLTATPNNQSKVYGAANPDLTINYSGFVNGDDATNITPPVASTAVTLTTGVGAYPITLTGGSATNYSFNLQTGTLSVTPAPLTARAQNRTKVYGAANPPFGIAYTGFVNGDNATNITPPTASTTATAASDAGTYPITLTGGTAANYTFTLQPGTLTISKATLTAKADDKSRSYGAANPPNTITYTGFVNGDGPGDITPPTITGPAANGSSPVGTYPITLSGGTATNYNFSLQDGTLTIGKAILSARADDKSRAYGAADPTFTITYNGFVNGENASNITAPTASTTAVTTSNVGTYPITLAGTTPNYDFNFTAGTLTVNKANLTVTAENKSRPYGSQNPALTVTYSGLVNSETPAVIDNPPGISTIAADNSPVGNYTITLTAATDNNYNITTVNGTLSVTKAALIAKADNKSRAYGAANPPNTITYTGFVNGEGPGSLTAQPTASTSANATSPVGTYPIVLSSGSAANYDITFQNGTLTVTKALITVTAANQNRPYGAANPTLTLNYIGFVNGQTVTVINTLPTASTPATLSSPVGTYTISAAGGDDDNYQFTYVNGVLTINKATLTATADSKITTYGTIPPLSITYTGFANSEDASVIDTKPTTSTTATATSDIGTYPIAITGGTDNNYTIVNVSGTLTINKATLTVTADNKARVIGLPNPPLTITYTGFRNNESADVLDTPPTISTTADLQSAPGNYPIVVSGGSDNHYNLVYQNGTMIVVLDNPPVANNFTVDVDEDVPFLFPLALFEANRTDDAAGKIIYIKVTSLPQNGSLMKGNVKVAAGDNIDVVNNQLDLTYIPNVNYNGNDAFGWNVFDGTFLGAASATVTLKIRPVNDPPVLNNIESTLLPYSLGDPGVRVSETVIINDVDDNFIFSATVKIATNFTPGDELSISGGVGGTKITSAYANGELKLTGKDTRATYENMLHKVLYSSSVTGEATISEKNITMVVRDSTADSNIASRTIQITEVFPELDLVNAFTPNDDGINDTWEILNLDLYSDIKLLIFDMNGIQVYKCTSGDCLWDGTVNGKPLPAGPYSYIIDLNNGKRRYQGTVTILK